MLRKTSSPTFELFDDDTERRSFAFFKDRTLAEISGYFPSDFWERLVPLAAFHEPALKHASIALASLHERFEKGDRSILKSNKDVAEGGFALQQYNKAIRCLITPRGGNQKPALDTSLVACVLFACFEVREPILTSMLIGTRPMLLPQGKPNAHPGFNPDIPVVFKSLEEARNSLDYQWNLYLQKAVNFQYLILLKEGTESQEHRDANNVDRSHFRAIFEKWMTAYQVFLDRNVASMNSKSLQGAMVVKMHAKLGAMHLEFSTFQLLHDPMCWDKSLPVFEDLVSLAAAVIDAQNAADEKGLQKPVFQLDHSIIGPLFSVSHKCRDPYLRRKAISMLYSAPRQEGVWDSILTARVCERIMNLEEEGLGEVKAAADVPGLRRIIDIQVTFDLQARRGEIKFLRLRSLHSDARKPVIDVFEW
ncbi:MAG: hypothetical protein Q9178_007692 [Gyalolechia marmorata]